MLIAIGMLVSVLMVVLYSYLTWNFDYWKRYGILYEKPLIFYGNMKDAFTGKEFYGLAHHYLYNKFNKVPYFGFFKLREPTVVIRDLDIIKDVLVKEFNSFADNDNYVDVKQDQIFADNPFFITGEQWKLKRAQWSVVMTASRVKIVYDTMTEKSDIMVEYLKTHVKETPNQELDIRMLALKYLTDVAVSGILGLKVNSFEDPNNVFLDTTSNLFATDFWSEIQYIIYMWTPWLFKLFGLTQMDKKITKQIKNIVKNVVDVRKEHGFLKNDFFENLIKNDQTKEMDLVGRVFGFLSEGVETSSSLVTFTLFELASNPHIQTKLRNELEDNAAGNGGKLSYEEIHRLPYLDMVIQETLRTYPPIFSMNRTCTKEFVLPPTSPKGKPFTIPVGMVVTIPTYSTQQDPQYIQEPERFYPERFSEETKGDIPKFAFLPFGEGPRICIGMRLGLTNAKNCVAQIVKNFELRVSPKTKPKPLPIDPSAFVTRAAGGVWLTFHKI